MSCVRTLLASILPATLIGGLLFSSQSSHAEAGLDGALGFWPASSDTATGRVVVAQADPRPRARPRTPLPPAVPPGTPVPPAPPAPPAAPAPPARHGMSISIHDGKVEIDGVAEMVQHQLESVLHVLDTLPNVPPDLRERVKNRVKGVREKLKVRIGKLRSLDVDKIGPEMERLGDEIEREMEGLDRDLEKLGEKLGEHLGRQLGDKLVRDLGNLRFDSGDNSDDGDDADDADDADDPLVMPSPDADDQVDVADRIAALRTLTLDQGQKETLKKVRLESERQIADATRELEEMSNRLHVSLGDDGSRENDIARQIDQISQKEATIRKARILAWIKVRNVLRPEQRKRVEAAAKHHR